MSQPHLTYLETISIGLLQGITELFPVSSLGHSVLVPALIGGSWAHDLDVSATDSPYLAFLVAVHVATAIALVVFFRADWIRIGRGLLTSLRDRRVETVDQRLAWLLIIGTVPVGLVGLIGEHAIRTMFGKPVPAAIFLTLNGVVLFTAERLRRRNRTAYPTPAPVGPSQNAHGQPAQVYRSRGYSGEAASSAAGHAGDPAFDLASDQRITRLSRRDGVLVGAAQILALMPGISRSGATMAAGLLKGLTHEDAARFAFLLATPVIAAAGVLKLPDLAGPTGHGVLGPVLVGSIVAGAAAYLSLRFLTRYFETRTLTPFAIYCFIAGLASLVWLGVS
jgi:undecaprenyl-diphosphatase